MGANEFFHIGIGKTASDAFRQAQEEARYDYGHSGYSGTIAEKDGFTMIDDAPENASPEQHAEHLISVGDKRIDDKWGPAGCIKLDAADRFLFFGWASS